MTIEQRVRDLEKDMNTLKGEVRVIITMNVAILLIVAFLAIKP